SHPSCAISQRYVVQMADGGWASAWLRSPPVKRNAVPLVAVIAAAALIGLLVYGVAQRGENRTLDDAVANGHRPAAPDRPLPVLGGGGQRSLASFRGKPVVPNFWASWCSPCRLGAPLLERAPKRLAAHGGTVRGVTYRDASPDSPDFGQRTTLADVEDEVMCVLGGTARNISESSQADRERAFIRNQIRQGKTKEQVKQALVGQYGPAVLAMPQGGGFNIAAWLVPAALVLALIAGLAVLVPRWRRRSRLAAAAAPEAAAVPALSAADARRLEEDIARYER